MEMCGSFSDVQPLWMVSMYLLGMGIFLSTISVIRNRVGVCLAACMSKQWNKLMNMNDGRHVKEATHAEHKHRPWPDIIHNLYRKHGVIQCEI